MDRLSNQELATILIPLLTFILGIAQVCADVPVLTKINAGTTSLMQYPPAPIFGIDNLANFPDDFVYGVAESILVAGSLAIFTSLIALLQTMHMRYPDSMPKQWHLIYRGTLYSSMVAILVIFIYASVEESKSSHWEFTDTYSTGGRFAPESWNCQIRPYFTELGSVCNSARAGRWLSLPILLCFAILAFFDIRPRENRKDMKGYIPR